MKILSIDLLLTCQVTVFTRKKSMDEVQEEKPSRQLSNDWSILDFGVGMYILLVSGPLAFYLVVLFARVSENFIWVIFLGFSPCKTTLLKNSYCSFCSKLTMQL